MKRKLVMVVFALLCSATSLRAQAAVPARPVDPTQAVPAQPVAPKAAVARSSVDSGTSGTAPAGPQLTVLADSSLRAVLQELAQGWADSQSASPQVPLTLTNAATMVNQVQSNPAWDVVIGADMNDVKNLTDKGLLVSTGQRSLARNTLVIYARKALVKDDDLDWFDMVGAEWKKVAMGNPDLAESGRVARRALEKHDLFDDDHKKNYVNAPTETLALKVVERDQADAVFVYRTDLVGVNLPGFEVVPLNATDAPPVFYTASVGRLSKNPEGAQSFINYCTSEGARDVWTRYGFEMN